MHSRISCVHWVTFSVSRATSTRDRALTATLGFWRIWRQPAGGRRRSWSSPCVYSSLSPSTPSLELSPKTISYTTIQPIALPLGWSHALRAIIARGDTCILWITEFYNSCLLGFFSKILPIQCFSIIWKSCFLNKGVQLLQNAWVMDSHVWFLTRDVLMAEYTNII